MLLLKRFDNYRLLCSFRFQNEGKMVSFLNKLKYLSSQSVLCQIHCIDFLFQQDLSFGGIPIKILFVVFEYELINYLINYEIIILYNWLCNY